MSRWFSRRELATKANLSERERAFHVAMRSPGRNEEGGSEEAAAFCRGPVASMNEDATDEEEYVGVGRIVEADFVSCEKAAGSTKSKRELIGRQICAVNSVFLNDRVGRHLGAHNERKLSAEYLIITMLERRVEG